MPDVQEKMQSAGSEPQPSSPEELLKRYAEWIERFGPDLVLSGHIHNTPFLAEGSWIDRVGKTWVFNPGRQPGQVPAYLRIDLEAMTAEWISCEGRLIHHLALADG